MPGGGLNPWDDMEENSPALNHVLERMNQDFRPTQHYQPGFVPAAAPPWTSTTSAASNHPNIVGHNASVVDPQHNQHLHNHLGPGGPTRSYSASQEIFSDMGNSRTPLLRSSSDLGIRLGPFHQSQGHHFTDRPLDGILDSSVDSLEGTIGGMRDNSVFFPQPQQETHARSCGTPVASTTPPPLQQPCSTTQGITNINTNAPQQQQFSFYSESENHLQGMSAVNNLTAKLSNFTASLGSWFGPLDPFRTSMAATSSPDTIPALTTTKASSDVMSSSSLAMGNQPNSTNQNITSHPVSNCNRPNTSNPQQTSKPRYSDVLSKNTSSDKPATSTPRNNTQQQFPTQSSSPGLQNSRNNHSSSYNNKNKRNIGSNNSSFGNMGYNNISNQNSNKYSNRNDTGSSRVGLDGFDVPNSMNNYGNISGNNNKNNLYSSNDSLNEKIQYSSCNSNDSPTHHGRRNSIRNDKRTSSEKSEGSNRQNSVESDKSSVDNDRSSSDQLNNRLSSSSQKSHLK